jgi:L-iditol 2-dehydrogenase
VKAFVQTGIGLFEARDVPRPRPGPGEAVARVLAAVTCGTDLKLLRRGHARIALPATMGHELCAEIVEVGAGADPSLLGARVVPGISGPCGACEECRAGLLNLCAAGHADRTWGAFAAFIRIPAGVVARNLHRVPPDLSDEAAAFLDPLASVLHGWNRLGPLAPGSRLLVYGSGALAFLWARTGALRGIRCVIAGRRPERAAMAEAFGARFDDLTAGVPEASADAAVDATGEPEVWSLLPGRVRPGGRVLLFGGCAPETTVSFDAARLHYAEVSLIGAFHSTPSEAAEALGLLASGAVDPRPLLAATGTLEDLPRFLAAQAAGEGLRYAVRPAEER